MKNYLLFSFILSPLLVLPSVSVSQAQIASALIREGDTLPGDSSGFLIRGIASRNAQNGVGGFAFGAITSDATDTEFFDYIWGNATGGSGTVLRSQSTFNNLEQTSINSFGINDAGMLAYHGTSTNTASGATSLDGLWLDSTLILNEDDPISTLPGNFSTRNDEAGITREGTAYWKGYYSPTQGETSSNSSSAIFYGTGKTVLLKSGDNISGVTETVAASSQGITRNLKFSASGSNYINLVLVDTGSSDDDGTMVSNGSVMLAGGSVIREQASIPTSIGGLSGELYDNFGQVGITESGSFMITGNTDAGEMVDEFIMIDGQIVLREGDLVDGLALNGDIDKAFLNEDGDWAAVWGVDVGTDTLDALIMNGEIVLLEGDLVDWNNDGVINGSDQNGFVANFDRFPYGGLTLGDRDANGDVRLLFAADVDLNGTLVEGGFSMSISAVPEPSSMMVLLLVGGPMLARRCRRV